jgi:glycosyltransferase involved in cell wall biosynthesis
MRILLLSTSVVPVGTERYGGIELLVHRFAQGLVKWSHEVTVAAPYGSLVPEGVKLIETVRLPEQQDRDDIALDAIGRQVHNGEQRWDLIHDFSHSQFLGREATGREARIPALFMLWDPVTVKYDKALYNMVCLSEWQMKRYQEMYKRNAVVLPNGCVDALKFHPDQSVSRNERFLFLGKLSPEKGPDLAIQMCKEAGYELDVVGGLIPSEAERMKDGYLGFLKQEADGEKIQVHFNVTEDRKIRFLQTCRALIYPVRQEEAHWLAGIEAWLTGAATITYDKGAMKEISPYRVAASREEFFDLMTKVDEFDRGLARHMAVTKYAMPNVIPKYATVYKEVMKGARW